MTTAQPFQGSQKIVIEKRDADGQLDFSEPQPAEPLPGWTFDDLYVVFFSENRDAKGTWEELKAWLDKKGWTIRAKTW